MDFDFPPDDDPRRTEIRRWLEENPAPSADDLLVQGYIVPHWPAPYGLSADPMHQIIIDEELARAGVRRPSNPIGIGWAA
ncbi:MAG: alkylation response protein AidB-like acyl-CoA dehydrogenase, partial [Candidatus Aldehydirespiratoraceae bacterium]